MNLKTIAIASAVGSLLALGSVTASAGDEAKEKCAGVAPAGENDCASAEHSCAGQATQARDPKSFVLLPAGDCSKIQGGSLKSA